MAKSRARRADRYWQCTNCLALYKPEKHLAQNCCYEITAMWYRLGAPGSQWYFKLRGRALEAGRQYGLKVYRVTRYRVRK